MLGGLARVVETVFREFHAESVKRALVHACDEPFHRLAGQKLKPAEALLQFRCGLNGHGNRVE
jgi:hypothetical protein